jgi:hypothetical protein
MKPKDIIHIQTGILSFIKHIDRKKTSKQADAYIHIYTYIHTYVTVLLHVDDISYLAISYVDGISLKLEIFKMLGILKHILDFVDITWLQVHTL